jgi:hypothetical protein
MADLSLHVVPKMRLSGDTVAQVRGGQIMGTYPELRADGLQSVSSTGAMLPTSPWEAIWKPLSLWLGAHIAILRYSRLLADDVFQHGPQSQSPGMCCRS